MGLFQNLNTEGHEERTERAGGGFQKLDTDTYAGKIKVAYAGQSEKGARNVTFQMVFDGKDYSETIYVTNKKGETFFEKDGKKVTLPGFNTVDDICQIVTGKPLAEQDTEEKTLKIYDFDAKAEVPKAVHVLSGLTDADILVAIEKILENKSSGAPDYTPIADTREVNNIAAVFHPEFKLTVLEAKRGVEEPEFINTWLTRNKGQTRDKRTIKDGQGGQSGRPGKAAGGPPQASGSSEPKKSLFGNKK